MKVIICISVVLLVDLKSGDVLAWTKARLASVDVNLKISHSEASFFTTKARFEVSGGQFHGFDLAPQQNSVLVNDECYAQIEGGLRAHVKIKQLFDGRTRIVLAAKQSIREGAVVFTLVHKTNLQEIGALRKYNNRARLDWTPIIWDHGTDAMTVTVTLPNKSTVMDYENEATEDYEVLDASALEVTFKKHRTVKWYPMEVVVDFDETLVLLQNTPQDATSNEDVNETSLAAVSSDPVKPLWAQSMPVLISFIGLLLMILKVRGVQRAHSDVGISSTFKLLRNTGFAQRFALSFLAVAVGAWAQHVGSIAASVPPLAIAAALWLLERTEGVLLPRPGGSWRTMKDGEITELRKIHSTYKRRRQSWLDISTLRGTVTFCFACVGILYAIWIVKEDWPKVVWAISVSGIIWLLPIWFSFSQGELPVDPTIESFQMLKKWKQGLSRLVGKMAPDAKADYWIREDEHGPIEIRLRVTPVPQDLTGLEIATEVVKTQTIYKVRKVAIIRMSPGTETARRLAACANAAEHHLTPDLKQEIIVLRNRRGKKDAGFTHLRNALALIR